MTLDDLKKLLLLIWAFDEVKFIVGGIVLNVVVSVAAALKAGQFQFAKLGEFLVRKLGPYVLIYVVARLFGDAVGLAGLATIVWGLITVTLIGSITAGLAELGIEMPAVLKKPEEVRFLPAAKQ